MSYTYTAFANGQWDPTANALGPVAVLTDPLVLVLVDTALYVADQDADVSLDDIPAGGIIATQPLTGVTVIDRALSADPTDFAALVGATVNAALIAKDTGTPSTSPLIAYLDDWATGIPFTPDGSDRTIAPDSGGYIVL